MPNISKILVLYGQPNLMKNIFDTVTGKITKKNDRKSCSKNLPQTATSRNIALPC